MTEEEIEELSEQHEGINYEGAKDALLKGIPVLWSHIDKFGMGAEHDIIYICPLDDLKNMTKEDLIFLFELGYTTYSGSLVLYV